MHWGYCLKVVGVLVLCVGACMILPAGFALSYGEECFQYLLASMAVATAAGLVLVLCFHRAEVGTLGHREGMVIVALGWISAGMVGALPYLFGGYIPNVVDALFESFSGFTTTGATILTDIEVLPRGILLWRSLTHWLGGMGIIVLSLAILPFLGVGGMQLYKAEVPGPVPDKLRPRIKDTALTLWKVYLLFSVVQAVLLMFGGMDLFNALCHTFGTMATGGFSTKNASIAAFDSVYIDTVIILFMLVGGINFALHYQMLRGRPLAMWRDPEFRFFATVLLIFTTLVVIYILPQYDSWAAALRYGSFQVVSILTTTGYGTADYELWAPLPQAVLLLCMFIGGCAGSTSGGMKCMRIMLLFKQSYRELFKLIHPRSVSQLKLGGKVVKPEVMSGIWGFFLLYLGLFALSSIFLAALGVDVLSAFAAVTATIGNIGPGLGSVGPTDTYANIPQAGKMILTLCMLLGRLEIYTIIILFVPEFWRK